MTSFYLFKTKYICINVPPSLQNITNIWAPTKRFIFNIRIKFLAPVQPEPINVCQPSPCGPNAQCQISGNSPSCSCLPEFIGSPPYCKPECISNSECPTNLACINQKCRDPCPGSCGANAECRIISHTPMCVCSSGFVGDPFVQCTPKPGKKTLAFPESILSSKRISISHKRKFTICSYPRSRNRETHPMCTISLWI